MATYSVDDTEEIRKTLLTIAAGSLACLSARADSALVASYGAPGFDNQPAAMYSDRQRPSRWHPTAYST